MKKLLTIFLILIAWNVQAGTVGTKVPCITNGSCTHTGDQKITGDLTVTDTINSPNAQFINMKASRMMSYAGETAGVSNCVLYLVGTNFGAGNTETNLCNTSLNALYDANYASGSTNVGFTNFIETNNSEATDITTVADDDSLSMEADAWSLAIWVRKDPPGGTWDLISKGGTFPYEWRLKIDFMTPYMLFVDDEDDFVSIKGANNALTSGNYHWVVVTYDPTAGSGATYAQGLETYVNGVNNTTTRTDNANFSDVKNGTIQLTMNYQGDSGSATGAWADLYYVVGKTWSQAEITEMWLWQRGNACQ